jgi:hypothetical protein
MESDGERILESIQQICDLYHNDVSIYEAIELMRDKDVSSELVKSIYDQLSKEDDKLMKGRFYYYYTSKADKYWLNQRVGYWTSRYLVTAQYKCDESAFHEIEIIDFFSDKSM